MNVFDKKPVTKGYKYLGLDKDPQKDAWETGGFGDRDRVPPVIHYGIIASGDSLIKDSTERDQVMEHLSAEGFEPICLEMEAAGIMNSFPCVVIRGICDYANEQKNDEWQEHAAGVAAAYAKELLMYVKSSHVEQSKPVGELANVVELHEKKERQDEQDRAQAYRGPTITHSGSGSVNTNVGNGSQNNYYQSGSNNRQINARNISTYNES